jgi:TnpA family transposase
MKNPEILLTEDQRKELTQIPPAISDWKIAKYYTLSDTDLQIINQRRRDHNKIGFAVQLCLLRYPGWSLVNVNEVPFSVLSYIAAQISVNIDRYQDYAQREKTRREHLQEIRQTYGFTVFCEADSKRLQTFLIPYALENDNILRLIKLAIEELRRQKIILPGITTIEKIVSKVNQDAEQIILKTINGSLTVKQKQQLDKLIESSNELLTTTLVHLKEEPGQSSPAAFMNIIERLEIIREFNLNIDLRNIHPNRIKQLSRLGSKYEPHSFRRFEESKRYAMLALYLIDLSQRLVDFAVEIHDRQINILLSKGRKQQEEIQKQNGKSLNEKIIQFIDIGSALIKSRQDGLDPFKLLETIMPWNKIVASIEDAKKLTRPKNYDYLDLLDRRYNQLRKYTPALVKYLKFSSTNSSMNSLIEALNIINDLNENGKRRMPEYAPVDFISSRWTKYLFNQDGTINRHYYEMAALTELKNRIRSGDVAVEDSRNYKNFDEYVIPTKEWHTLEDISSKLAVSRSFKEYLQERTESLQIRVNWLSDNIDKLDGVNIINNKIRLDKLEKETPNEAVYLSERLYKMLPQIKLADLLLEVSTWTGFDRYFTHASTNNIVKGKEKPIVMAALMAMGTNIGLAKMADSTPGISYHQMANAAQWRMYDDAMKRVQSCLVNYQHKLSLSSHWGDGTTSSSDGMRVQVGVSSLTSDHNPHYGSNKGATMYRFVSDQFSSFYTQIINTNARDAVHVIDGLLYHETDLCIDEHYTDTAGYTDQVFGLSHLLGFKFAPRIRDISDLKLFYFSKITDLHKMEDVMQGRINTNIILENYEDVLRLAYSIKEGKVSGSLIMSKLGSYARQNSLATALREMGRIEKTIFILDYISDEALRRRIQRGLNKGEAMNALARAIFFGKRGELRERELQDQLQRASALNILINAICVWNTKYLEKAIDYLKTIENMDERLLKHISPLNWSHINFLGEYSFDVKNMPKPNEFRLLNLND